MAALCVALALAACKRSPSQTGSGEPMPSQVLQGFEIQDIKNGMKSMSLRADEGKFYDDEQSADLDKPVVTFFKNGKASSVMTAPLGRVNTETKAIEGWGGVKVVTTDGVTLTTERLVYDPSVQQIISTTTVRLEKPDSVTVGQGLRSDPEMKRVKISKQKVQMK